MEDRTVFENSICQFVEWLNHNGTTGYDPYDLWSTRYGTHTRRMFYRYGNAAALMVAPLVLADRLVPSIARIGTEKKPYATSHAHLILGLLKLYENGFGGKKDWLNRAAELADELEQIKIQGYSGDCWGYPFDWENRQGFWPKNTPLITVTPYCFEALIALYKATGDSIYLERAQSVIQFALRDLNNIDRPGEAIASSYSPLDRSLVINASAYRAFILIKGSEIFSDAAAKEFGDALVQFVLDSQRRDGSWPYALEANGDDFVDHFHTCFVLKNLVKIYKIHSDPGICEAIERGYTYYKQKLFDRHGLPKPFAEGGNKLLRYSLYDFAEAISLGVLLRDLIPKAFENSTFIARETVNRFQLADGHFATSVG
ncbi:MAG TPA: hypothetical protein VEV84_08760, partial [Pyrinomonadaceae bacterium]|nr:hypothetical protein [Pyrinomonadaceae bacterium]